MFCSSPGLKCLTVGLVFFLASCKELPPETRGMTDGRFASCDGSFPCVSTQSDEPATRIGSIPYSDHALALKQTKKALANIGASVVEETPHYLRVEFRWPVLGPTQDAEFNIDPKTKTIEFRSWSRIGFFDFGKTRSHMEDFRFHFHQAGL